MTFEVVKTKTDDEGCEYRLALVRRGLYSVFFVVKGRRKTVLYDVIGGNPANYRMPLVQAREVFEQCGAEHRCAERAKLLAPWC